MLQKEGKTRRDAGFQLTASKVLKVLPRVSAGKKDNPLLMSDVNHAEVKYLIVKKDGAEGWAGAAKVPIDFHSTTRALADFAADCKARFKLSLADAFAAALAKERKAELVTGDAEFRALDKEIKITG
jgi:predicted nucleic acid-binding protein